MAPVLAREGPAVMAAAPPRGTRCTRSTAPCTTHRGQSLRRVWHGTQCAGEPLPALQHSLLRASKEAAPYHPTLGRLFHLQRDSQGMSRLGRLPAECTILAVWSPDGYW